MAEPVPLSPALSDAFRMQSAAGAKMGSPFMQRLCGLFAEQGLPDSATRDALIDWRGNLTAHGESLPVRLCAALHELVLSGADANLGTVYPPHHEGHDDAVFLDVIVRAIRQHDGFLLARLAYAPQTNEIRRSSAIYAALSHIAARTGQPLRLSEIGASAGLNLMLDRFCHIYDGAERGFAGSTVRLTPQWSGALPPDLQLNITERRGCDLTTFDLTLDEDCTRLLSYNWADQAERIERMRAAIDIARALPPQVDQADAIDWLEQRLEQRHPGEAHVLYHTIAWQYLPEAAQQAGRRLIEAAGDRATNDSPLFLVSLEMDGGSPGAGLRQTSWPGGKHIELARVDTHGRWIDWR